MRDADAVLFLRVLVIGEGTLRDERTVRRCLAGEEMVDGDVFMLTVWT